MLNSVSSSAANFYWTINCFCSWVPPNPHPEHKPKWRQPILEIDINWTRGHVLSNRWAQHKKLSDTSSHLPTEWRILHKPLNTGKHIRQKFQSPRRNKEFKICTRTLQNHLKIQPRESPNWIIEEIKEEIKSLESNELECMTYQNL